MNLKQYQNELILAVAFILALSTFVYKNSRHRAMSEENQQMSKEVAVVQETAGLQKIWGDKRLAKRVELLRSLIAPSKVKWQKKGKKLTATFVGLQPSEVNKVMSKFLNIPVQIETVHLQKNGETYNMEIKCKW